jgi:hypothetical protein
MTLKGLQIYLAITDEEVKGEVGKGTHKRDDHASGVSKNRGGQGRKFGYLLLASFVTVVGE